MGLQEEIFSIQEYFKSIEYFGKGIVVKVQFPPKWTVYPSQDGIIKVTPDENIPNIYFYFTNLNEGKLEQVFDLIRETVEMNLSVIKKIELMKKKIEELKELFATNDLDKLETLEFVFAENGTTNKAKKRKYNRKKKEETKETVEETVEEKAEITETNNSDNNE